VSSTNDDRKIRFQLEPWNRGIPNEEILDDIRRVSQSLGQNTVKYEEYEKVGRVSCFTVEKRFGSWNNALSKAGLQVTRYVNIPKEKLFEDIERVWTRLGRQPRWQEMKKPLSLYSKGTYQRRFRTWRKALEEFINYINSESDGEFLEPIVSRATQRSLRQPNLRLRFLVMRRDNFRCRFCGKSPATHPNVELQVDHIVSWSEGGQTVLENLQTLCTECNLGKGNQPPTEPPD
jgi:hypothetical protein